MSDARRRPDADEVEFTLLGPGYGESALVHLGSDTWIVVDSFVQRGGEGNDPAAIRYLESIGVNPGETVELIVATHWHDDHIGGIADLIERCPRATFCCSAALSQKEFLAAVGALGAREVSVIGSGVREIYEVFSMSRRDGAKREFALANRLLLREDDGEVWALSPDANVFERFLATVSDLVSDVGQPKRRLPSLSPNEASVVLWIRVGDVVLLLGADQEKRGWKAIVELASRPDAKASAFKLPHHGSADAHHNDVWDRMLVPNPVAVLAPWTKGGWVLPRRSDVQRILKSGAEAYVTVTKSAMNLSARHRNRHPAVARTIQGSGIKLQRVSSLVSGIRMRRSLRGATHWTVENLGAGSSLRDFSGGA